MNIIAFVALGVSIASLFVSFYNVRRDRGRIRAIARAFISDRSGEYASITITIANVGRRPVALRYLWGKYHNGSQGGEQLDETSLKLLEGDLHVLRYGKFDGIMINDCNEGENVGSLVDLFLEDTGGKKHKIQGAKAAIQLLCKGKHPL